MGLVYLAHDVGDLRRKVVVKTLKEKALTSEDKEYLVKHFRQEAEALKRMNHNCIVRFLEYDQDHDTGREFLVMEYAEGSPLSDLMSRGWIEKTRCVRIVEDIAFALRHAHEQDVYHRDLKPDNIIFNEGKDGEPDRIKLIDFGLSKVRLSNVGPSTKIQLFAGTLEYASPEQLNSEISIAAESFCLATVAYHMLTRQPPFPLAGYKGDSPNTWLRKLHKQGAVSPSKIREGLPSNIDMVFKKAFEVDPENRYQSPYEFARALSNAVVAPNPIPHQPVVYPRRRLMRKRGMKILLALAMLLGLALLYYLLFWE